MVGEEALKGDKKKENSLIPSLTKAKEGTE